MYTKIMIEKCGNENWNGRLLKQMVSGIGPKIMNCVTNGMSTELLMDDGW